MKKKIVFSSTIIVFIVISLYFFDVFPLVIKEKQSYATKAGVSIEKGDIINPLKECNMDEDGNYEMYLYIAKGDINELPMDIPKHKILYTGDLLLIKNLIKSFDYKYSGSDMCTCESCICLYRNNKVIFYSNILINKDLVGIQNSAYGWMKAENYNYLINIFKQLKPIYRPIVFL